MGALGREPPKAARRGCCRCPQDHRRETLTNSQTQWRLVHLRFTIRNANYLSGHFGIALLVRPETPIRVLGGSRLRFSLMDSLMCQNFAASPAKASPFVANPIPRMKLIGTSYACYGQG